MSTKKTRADIQPTGCEEAQKRAEAAEAVRKASRKARMKARQEARQAAREKAERIAAARVKAGALTPEAAGRRLEQMEAERKARLDHGRRMAQLRVMELKGGRDKARQSAEEKALAARRRELLEAAKEERKELRAIARARRIEALDVTIAEQCDRHAFTIRPPDGSAPRRVRRGVVHDPRFSVPEAHFDSACKLEKLWAEAARLGSRGCDAVEAWAANGGVRSTGEGDEDEDRARIVAADRAVRVCLARIPDAPEVKTPAGWRSQRDAIMVCVLEALPLRALAQTDDRRRHDPARALLKRALETLAKILPADPGEKILA